jgi:hypothetical protein
VVTGGGPGIECTGGGAGIPLTGGGPGVDRAEGGAVELFRGTGGGPGRGGGPEGVGCTEGGPGIALTGGGPSILLRCCCGCFGASLGGPQLCPEQGYIVDIVSLFLRF